MFDFDAAVAESLEDMNRRELEAIIMAASGGGKSSILGTFGLPTLYLYFTGENHGPRAAQKRCLEIGEGKIIPYCLDLYKGERLTAEQTLDNLAGVLLNRDMLADKGIQAIAFDGCSELEISVRESPGFKKACLSDKNKHNAFQEPAVTTAMFRPVLNALKDLQRLKGMHFAATSMLDVKDVGTAGDIVEASPRLRGYGVAEQLLQQFNDVLVVGKMTKTVAGKQETKYKLQFMTDIVKTAKEESGAQKRAMNFNPRVAGFTPPPYMDADLRTVIALKKGNG